MITGVDHIDIRTPDLDSTLTFLKTLGLKEVRRLDPERGSVEVALPGEGQVVFEVRPDPAAQKAYVHHVAFGLEGLADIEALAEQGVSFTKANHFVTSTGRTVSNATTAGQVWQFTD